MFHSTTNHRLRALIVFIATLFGSLVLPHVSLGAVFDITDLSKVSFRQKVATKKDPIEKKSTSSRTEKSSVGSSLSPIYSKLPADAKKVTVRNVYDGDTLTLVDGERVRFLGIDTPEIKEQQPFAQQAKEYTKGYCHKKDIWVSLEPGNDSKDHYGRLLAWIWVRTENGYLCVNEGLVLEGLASVYTPNKNTKFKRMPKLLSQQKHARNKRLGILQDFMDYNVVATPYGAAYHKSSCRHLQNSRRTTVIKMSEALDKGLHPCRTCQS